MTLKFGIEMQKIWYMKRGNLENNDQIGIKFLLLLNHYLILFIISVWWGSKSFTNSINYLERVKKCK